MSAVAQPIVEFSNAPQPDFLGMTSTFVICDAVGSRVLGHVGKMNGQWCIHFATAMPIHMIGRLTNYARDVIDEKCS